MLCGAAHPPYPPNVGAHIRLAAAACRPLCSPDTTQRRCFARSCMLQLAMSVVKTGLLDHTRAVFGACAARDNGSWSDARPPPYECLRAGSGDGALLAEELRR